jgi:hypothetical protein
VPVIVKQYGKQVAEVADDNAAFEWLLKHQGQSVSYALRHGGYSVTDENGRESADWDRLRKQCGV